MNQPDQVATGGQDDYRSQHSGVGSTTAGLTLDAFALADRLKLFNFTRRGEGFLWVLRAVEQRRASHRPRLHVDDVAEALVELAAAHPDVPQEMNLRYMLDELVGDKVLAPSDDASRAGSLAAYRRRHTTYQFTELGYRAYTAVEDVLSTRSDEVSLSRLVFADVLADFRALAEANLTGDGEEVYRKLSRLDAVLADMTRRAARFYLMLDDLARGTDASPETFLRYKDALLAHMADFASDLARYAPRLAEAVHRVEASGVEVLLTRAAEADERVFATPQARLDDWRRRWQGLRDWFCPSVARTSDADQLQTATVSAIGGVVGLLRQVLEGRRSGVSRQTQLRHLAQWVMAAPDDDAAHAIISAGFNWRAVRHLSGGHADPELISSRLPWWQAPGVPLSVSMLRHGKRPSPGPPAPLRRADGARAMLRSRQLAARAAAEAAEAALADGGATGRTLDQDEVAVLLRLLTLALETRTVVSGRLLTARASTASLRITLTPSAAGSVVRTAHGRLHLPGVAIAVAVEPATRVRPRRKGNDQ
ncbi:TIGR02677 family protein [Micromonospora rhizosphaerae]|uniref:TIGR02677 family protein n=1 Tax=Micromonospora rhizosphaerae TaxID=568872 RepID=UPI001FE1B277|nr:TIGR02677 family protein [Micromonospora rhizosphaerae]